MMMQLPKQQRKQHMKPSIMRTTMLMRLKQLVRTMKQHTNQAASSALMSLKQQLPQMREMEIMQHMKPLNIISTPPDRMTTMTTITTIPRTKILHSYLTRSTNYDAVLDAYGDQRLKMGPEYYLNTIKWRKSSNHPMQSKCAS